MKKCPYCAEEIQDEAIKCRYCGSDLTAEVSAIKAGAFNLVLQEYGQDYFGVIEGIRVITGLGLKETKSLVESIPATIMKGLSWKSADEMKMRLEAKGATIVIVDSVGEYVPIGVTDKKAPQELIGYLEKKRKEDRSNTQSCGCLLVILGGVLAAVVSGAFGGLLALIGLIILIVGFVR